MAAEKTLRDAFHETLRDVYYAEKQSVRALRKSARAAQAPALRDLFETHGEESAHHVERLVRVFESIGRPARAQTCEAMQGLTAEMDEDLDAFGGTAAADEVLIGCAQAMEHYEIARYGLLRGWARKLGLTEAEDLLGQTLAEEKHADQLLSEAADGLGGGEGASEGDAEAEDDTAAEDGVDEPEMAESAAGGGRGAPAGAPRKSGRRAG
jgi:ferritin-like metal-binding protein YciE